jgi:hypothetical protein
MMIEAFGRLSSFAPLTDYQYVGFGSTFFIDFKLVHRAYGLTRLISIEKEQSKRSRFDFNKPFNCVRMHYGTAGEFLASSEMSWSRPSIIWLDYDYRLSNDVLADIDRVVTVAPHGTLLVVTVDAKPIRPGKSLLGAIERELGLAMLPEWTDGKPSKLAGWGLAQAYFEIARSSIEAAVRRARPDFRWQQTFHFRYSDGCPMLTLGGLIVEKSTEGEASLQRCRLHELSYYRDADEAFEIRLPNLTTPEIHKIAQQLPRLTARDRRKLTRLAIADQDIRDYQLLYRYLPLFVEASA